VDGETLSLLLDAIRWRSSVRISYQSDSDDQPIDRVISPHAFGYDGLRWHVRAYCFFREAYRDFVLGRVLSITTDQEPGRDPALDSGWNTLVRLVITANPDLTEGNRRAIERDYSMTEGETTIDVRAALLYYVLKQLQLGPFSIGHIQLPQLLLKNEHEIEPYLQNMSINRPKHTNKTSLK
jgi:predicted DNA-binding transcriptional regulator YafY